MLANNKIVTRKSKKNTVAYFQDQIVFNGKWYLYPAQNFQSS